MIITKEDLIIERNGSVFTVSDKETKQTVVDGHGICTGYYEHRNKAMKDGTYSNGIPAAEVYRAISWIEEYDLQKGKSQNTNTCSYNLKHRVENWLNEIRNTYDPEFFGNYVSNGAFITAALIKGFKVYGNKASKNCNFNILQKSLNQAYDKYSMKVKLLEKRIKPVDSLVK